MKIAQVLVLGLLAGCAATQTDPPPPPPQPAPAAGVPATPPAEKPVNISALLKRLQERKKASTDALAQKVAALEQQLKEACDAQVKAEAEVAGLRQSLADAAKASQDKESSLRAEVTALSAKLDVAGKELETLRQKAEAETKTADGVKAALSDVDGLLKAAGTTEGGAAGVRQLLDVIRLLQDDPPAAASPRPLPSPRNDPTARVIIFRKSLSGMVEELLTATEALAKRVSEAQGAGKVP